MSQLQHVRLNLGQASIMLHMHQVAHAYVVIKLRAAES